MTRIAICVGGPPALHGHLEILYASADTQLRSIPLPLVGESLQSFAASEQHADYFIWAACEPNEARFETLSTAAATEYLERNLYSLFSMLQPCLAGMERRRYGRVVALTNLGGRLGDEDLLLSTTSGAVEGLIRSLARESARKGVTANALQLGHIEDWPEIGASISRAFYQVFFPFREPFTTRDLARTLFELTTSEAGKINGQIIGFDGGTTL